MRRFCRISHLLLVLLLQRAPAQVLEVTQQPFMTENSERKAGESQKEIVGIQKKKQAKINFGLCFCSIRRPEIGHIAIISHPPDEGHSEVIPFTEVWSKSMCRPMEQLVDVEHEYPGEVGDIYIPACVSLSRCSGCCGDENLVCQPTLQRNVTLQVMRFHPLISVYQVHLTFVEHQTCECRARQKHLNNKSSAESVKGRPRRRKHKKTANGCGKCQFPQNKINPH